MGFSVLIGCEAEMTHLQPHLGDTRHQELRSSPFVPTEGCIVVSSRILISILSVSVEPLKMSRAEAVDALAPLWRFAESLVSDVRLQEVKFILNPVLPLRHLFWNLTRLRLCESFGI